MFKKLILGLALCLLATTSFAQTCPTRPLGDATNACADTKFVSNAIAAIPSLGITQLTGDVTAGPGSGSQASILATAQPGAHTWAAIQTFTLASVFTDPAGTRAAIGAPPGEMVNCSLAASVSANALTIALKTQAGGDPSSTSPCSVSFRSATATTGTYSSITVSAALSFSTGTSGSTFGSTNSVPFRLWITAWNNAGTLVLGVSNQSTTTTVFPINEASVASSTACNACTNATAAGTYYTTAAQTSKAIRILGYMDWASGLATAGTWASGPTTIQNFGPGVNRPGSIVQTAYAPATTATTGNSTNLVVAVPSINITPTSAPNLILTDARGILVQISTGIPSVQVYRAVGGSSACTTAVGSIASHNLGNNSFAPTTIGGLDAPGVASQLTYVVCLRASNASNPVYCIQTITTTCTITLQEIMGKAEDFYDNDNDPRLLNKVG